MIIDKSRCVLRNVIEFIYEECVRLLPQSGETLIGHRPHGILHPLIEPLPVCLLVVFMSARLCLSLSPISGRRWMPLKKGHFIAFFERDKSNLRWHSGPTSWLGRVLAWWYVVPVPVPGHLVSVLNTQMPVRHIGWFFHDKKSTLLFRRHFFSYFVV